MYFHHILVVLLFGVQALSQVQFFESPDFDATQALLDRDVDVEQLPKIKDSSLTTSAACSAACVSLKGLFGSGKVLSQGTSEYKSFVDSYWSKHQTLVEPRCIFYPTQASDVSKLVLVSRLTRCPFAVKSGGHSAFAGAANSIGGITVALERLNEIILSSDKKVASIGSGNLWNKVYSKLAESGMTVIGGRVANIGVGGLITGGGMSFLSNKHGWACDNVESFEVVIANGDIVIASQDSHPDLYWALRGGGNNFGIVTKFNLFAYEHGQMYGGSRYYAEEHLLEAIDGYHKCAFEAADDTNAMTFFAYGLFNKTRYTMAELAYAKEETSPAIFSKYLETPAVHDTRITRDMTNYTWGLQESNPNGLRQIFHLVTTKMTPEFNKFTLDAWYKESETIKDLASTVAFYILHPITIPMLEHMSSRGGNTLGLDKDDGPYQIHHINMMWSTEEEETRMYQALNNFFKTITQKAKVLGIMRDYIYMNYASQFQDVVNGYGKENKAKLEAIAKKYDPTGVFQILQPGYFKLHGGPYAGFEDWLSKTKAGKSAHDEL